jgi:hypothetical protein
MDKYPVVISDGQKILFTFLKNENKLDIPFFYKNWDNFECFEWKKMEYKTFQLDSPAEYKEINQNWYFHNQAKDYKGVDASRFLTKINMELINMELFVPGEKPYMYSKIHIFEYINDYVHINKFGHIDTIYAQNPYEIEGVIPSTSWIGNGKGIFWKRNGNEYEMFAEIISGKIYNYEINSFSVFENLQEKIKECQKLLKQKIRKSEIYKRKLEGKETQQLLLENFETEISFSDSVEVGNCEAGTKTFCSQFEIDIHQIWTFEKLYKHLKEKNLLDKACRNIQFCNVVKHCITKDELDTYELFENKEEM